LPYEEKSTAVKKIILKSQIPEKKFSNFYCCQALKSDIQDYWVLGLRPSSPVVLNVIYHRQNPSKSKIKIRIRETAAIPILSHGNEA
jgi:hypothetical protein